MAFKRQHIRRPVLCSLSAGCSISLQILSVQPSRKSHRQERLYLRRRMATLAERLHHHHRSGIESSTAETRDETTSRADRGSMDMAAMESLENVTLSRSIARARTCLVSTGVSANQRRHYPGQEESADDDSYVELMHAAMHLINAMLTTMREAQSTSSSDSKFTVQHHNLLQQMLRIVAQRSMITLLVFC